eukprot:6708067-Heterocapsa_arctica.AAC.1
MVPLGDARGRSLSEFVPRGIDVRSRQKVAKGDKTVGGGRNAAPVNFMSKNSSQRPREGERRHR